MRIPIVRFTVRRMMVGVFLVGVVVGGTIELDRASIRRAAYLDMAYRADWTGERSRSLASRFLAQAAAIREWVAGGAAGDPPGIWGRPYQELPPYTFDLKEAEEMRRQPERALSLASKCEQQALDSLGRAADSARRKQEFERLATFPRVLFVPDPAQRSPGSRPVAD